MGTRRLTYLDRISRDHLGASRRLRPHGPALRTFLIVSFKTTDVAEFDPTSHDWSTLSARTLSSASEESFVLLPDNTIASVSCNNPIPTTVYSVATGSCGTPN